MNTHLVRLREKLCRELAQSEYDAKRHTLREAKRLGDVPPSQALRTIADHAEQLRPRLDALLRSQRTGRTLGRAVGEVFSSLRHLLFDRLIDTERSYRGTLLGLRHGIDIVRLLREIAVREGDITLVHFCDEFLLERLSLIESAEEALGWFAEEPKHALTSGARIALQPAAK